MASEQRGVEETADLMSLFAVPLSPTRQKPDGLSTPGLSPIKHSGDELPSGLCAVIPEGQAVVAHTNGQGTHQAIETLQCYDDVNSASADMDAPHGSISYMMGLFAAPSIGAVSGGWGGGMGVPELSSTESLSSAPSDRKSLDQHQAETTPLLSSTFGLSRKDGGSSEKTPKSNIRLRKIYTAAENGFGGSAHHIRLPSIALPVIEEVPSARSQFYQLTGGGVAGAGKLHSALNVLERGALESAKPSTLIGSLTYLLYHVVFCLALGSAINRPHNSTSLLGLMTKTAALGTISSSAVYWFFLRSEIPALYPTADLFLAPFLANLAVVVDEALSRDTSIAPEDNDSVFLATFGILSAIGLCFSGTLLSLSGIFKLANLGSFLPFPVICGFFSAVGILTWTLAITVDTGGKSIGFIIKSGNPQLVLFTVIHHIPTVIVASVMKYLGPKNPFFVVFVVFATIGLFHFVMYVKGVSLEEAIEMGWFWSRDELVYSRDMQVGSPPAPFGVINQLCRGMVHWQAVVDGLPTVIALGCLYVIRCSVHGAALKKNLPNLSRAVKDRDPSKQDAVPVSPKPRKPVVLLSRQFSETVDIEAVLQPQAPKPTVPLSGEATKEVHVIQAKPSNIKLKDILFPYGMSQFVAALFGGFACTPSVAASSTMFSLGADGVAPQIGSAVLLLIFYITDFQLVGYIPKPAFSSMLVLAFIDMIYTWFYKSYFKINDKYEWMVVPAIVVCAFVFDLLSAVFLGIAFSTFIFVGSFFRSGVVKYVANGAVIHSTIERPFRQFDWLVDNGDFIQILVLQNYLFFGNASAVYSYIDCMFQRNEGDGGESSDQLVTRKPKFLILDLTLVTGMDTSTVDIFNDIRNLCISNNCKLFATGLTSNLRGILSLGGFKPETGVRSKRKLRFFASLDSALGKAEDLLLENECDEKDVSPPNNRGRLLSEGDCGFRTALRHIDEEHGENFSDELLGWQIHTQRIELNPGDQLYDDNVTEDLERGLFFIETGVLKIEHETETTLTRGGGSLRSLSIRDPEGARIIARNDSLTRIQAMEYSNILKASRNDEALTFRLARFGPGWIAGTVEAVSGRQRPGRHVAVTHCSLHHLSFSKIAEVEKTNPALSLSLYKLLAYMMARRQEATIGQLATLHSIMTSPPVRQLLRKTSSGD